jgi:hypothetical protein
LDLALSIIRRANEIDFIRYIVIRVGAKHEEKKEKEEIKTKFTKKDI